MPNDIFGLLPSVAAQERELASQQQAVASPAAQRRGGTLVTALGQRVAQRRQNERDNALGAILNEEYSNIVSESEGPVDVGMARANAHLRAAARLQAAGNHAAAAEQYQLGAAMVQQRRNEQLSNQKLEAEIGRAEAQTREAETDRMNAENLVVVDPDTLDMVGRITMNSQFGQNMGRYEQEAGKPLLTLSPEEFMEIRADQVGALDGRDFMTPTQIFKLVEQNNLAEQFTSLGSKLLRIVQEGIEAGQDVFSDVSKIEVTGNRARNIYREARSRWNQWNNRSDNPLGGQTQAEIDTIANDYMENRLDANAARRGITASLLTDMAYMFAMARNDRVTDADFDAAYSVLGGDSGVAVTALDTIASAIEDTNNAAARSSRTWLANEAFAASTHGQVIGNANGARSTAYDQFVTSHKEAMQRLGASRYKPETPASSGAQPRFEFVEQQ